MPVRMDASKEQTLDEAWAGQYSDVLISASFFYLLKSSLH